MSQCGLVTLVQVGPGAVELLSSKGVSRLSCTADDATGVRTDLGEVRAARMSQCLLDPKVDRPKIGRSRNRPGLQPSLSLQVKQVPNRAALSCTRLHFYCTCNTQHSGAHPELLAAVLHLSVLLLAAGVAVRKGGVLAEVQLLGLQAGAAGVRVVQQLDVAGMHIGRCAHTRLISGRSLCSWNPRQADHYHVCFYWAAGRAGQNEFSADVQGSSVWEGDLRPLPAGLH